MCVYVCVCVCACECVCVCLLACSCEFRGCGVDDIQERLSGEPV